jgi:phosphate transport system substrate-binding protein
VHTTQDKPAEGAETLKFFDWAFKNGGGAASDLDYISLPDAVVKTIRAQWSTKVKDASGKAVAAAQ